MLLDYRADYKLLRRDAEAKNRREGKTDYERDVCKEILMDVNEHCNLIYEAEERQKSEKKTLDNDITVECELWTKQVLSNSL